MVVHLIVVVILVAAAFGLKRYSPILTWVAVLVVLAWGGLLIFTDLSPAGFEKDVSIAMLVYAMAGLVLLVGVVILVGKSIAWLVSRLSQERGGQ